MHASAFVRLHTHTQIHTCTSRRMVYRARVFTVFSESSFVCLFSFAGICSIFSAWEFVSSWFMSSIAWGILFLSMFCGSGHVFWTSMFQIMLLQDVQFYFYFYISHKKKQKIVLKKKHLQSSDLLHLHIARRVSVVTQLRLATVWCSQRQSIRRYCRR